jgi:alanine racemase
MTPALGRGPELAVDLAAVAHNTRLVAARTDAAVMAVVKADGFGYGATASALTALGHGAGSLGVTTIEEALTLRAAGITAPVLSWLNPPGADFARALAEGVDLAVPSMLHLDAVLRAAEATRQTPRLHLHVDCGMSRDGCEPREWPRLVRRAARAHRAGRAEVVGVMGHLGCAEDPADPCNGLGAARFEAAVSAARLAGLDPRLLHLAATAATLTLPSTHHSMVRIGAGLAGIDPSGTTTLRGGLTLRAPLVAVRRVEAGDAVGYGHTWRATRPTRLGLVPLGYADGLPRLASDRAEVLVHGVRRPVVGRISMDQSVVDLGDVAAGPGEVVTVFGPGDLGEPTVAEWAAWAETIPHEIVTGIGPRVARVPAAAGLRRAG